MPEISDECKRLLDNGWAIVLFKSELGDYSAAAIGRSTNADKRARKVIGLAVEAMPESQITSDFEPSKSLAALPEKVFGCRKGGAS